MRFEIDEHIGIFDGYFTNNFCDDFIKYYKELEKNNLLGVRNSLNVKDKASDLITGSFQKSVPINYCTGQFVQKFFSSCYREYANKYTVLKDNLHFHTILDVKIQKTIPGEGYHLWHVENCGFTTRNRIAAFMLYLNDVEEGGETEFLYQKKRVTPKKDRCLIWPANYTHLHRGNQPLSGEKYVLTGWIEYSGN